MRHRERLRAAGISALDYYLSYLMDRSIEVVEGEKNELLEVILRRGRLQLCTEHAVYSYDDRYDNFRLLFESMDWSRWTDARVLCLGLGLGSVAMLLEQRHRIIQRLTSVEYDRTVIQLAQKYVLRHLQHLSHEVVLADAQSYVATAEGHYHLIVSDIFIDDKIPEPFKTRDYLYQLEDLLHPDGWLIINTLASSEEDRSSSLQYFSDVFLSIFPDGACYHCWENYMLVSRSDVVDRPQVEDKQSA